MRRGFYACSLASPEQIRCPDRWAHSRHFIKARSLHPTLPQSGGSATPSQLFQVPESQPGALLTTAPSPPSHGTNRGPVTYFLQWGHLPGPLACPWATLAALQLVEKLTAPLCHWKGPKRDWLLPKLLEGQTGEWPPQPATRGWGPALTRPAPPMPQAVRSGFSEPVCPPLPRPEQLSLRPVLWIGGVGWENGGLRSGWQRSKGGWWVGVIPSCHPSSPQFVKFPSPVPPAL